MRVDYVKDANGDDSGKIDYTFLMRIDRCRGLIADLEKASQNRSLSLHKRESLRVGMINVERKLREIVAELGSSGANEG